MQGERRRGLLPRISKLHALSAPTWLCVAFLLAVTMAVYGNALSNGFVYDDHHEVCSNSWITGPSFLGKIFTSDTTGFDTYYDSSAYRPLIHVCRMVVYALAGLSPAAFHLFNVTMHAGVVIVLFLVVREMLPERSGAVTAMAAALLFAVHPINTEAVDWISVPDPACALFFLLAFFLYVRAGAAGKWRGPTFVLAAFYYLLAMLFKEPAIVLPVVLAAHDYATAKRVRDMPLRRYLPFLAMAAVYLVLRYNALDGMATSVKHVEMTSTGIALNGLVLFVQYLGKLVLPVNMTAMYAYETVRSVTDPRTVPGIFAGLLFVAATWTARNNRVALVGLALILAPLAPALYLPAVDHGIMADRYLYLPSTGFAILAGCGAEWLRQKGGDKVTLVLLLTIVAAFSLGTVTRNRVWRDDLTLWKDAVAKLGGREHAGNRIAAARVHEYYATALQKAGRVEKAREHYRQALRIDDGLAEAYINLGTLEHREKQYDEAIRHYQQALRADAANVRALEYLAIAYQAQGNFRQALLILDRALALDPFDPSLYNTRGKLLANAGKFRLAARSFRKAVRLNPAKIKYRRNLDRTLALVN